MAHSHFLDDDHVKYAEIKQHPVNQIIMESEVNKETHAVGNNQAILIIISVCIH